MFDRDGKFDPTLLAVIIGGLLVVGFIVLVIYAVIDESHRPQAGYVFKKEYSPASDYVTTQTTTNGKTTTTSYVPHHSDEKFILWFRDTGSKEKHKDNWVYVPQDIWNKAQLGQWFDAACMCVVEK